MGLLFPFISLILDGYGLVRALFLVAPARGHNHQKEGTLMLPGRYFLVLSHFNVGRNEYCESLSHNARFSKIKAATLVRAPILGAATYEGCGLI